MVREAKQAELDYRGAYIHSAQSCTIFLGGLGHAPGNF